MSRNFDPTASSVEPGVQSRPEVHVQYDDKGKLTRAGAVQVIQAGGSVLVGGQIYSTIDKLPGEADFARGNAAAEGAARTRLQQQIADAQAQLAALPESEAPKARTHAATAR